MREKNKNTFHSPDMSKLKEVIIDDKTKIYIPMSADAQEARDHYIFKLKEKDKKIT